MIKRFVLKYIREHMTHENMEERNEIFAAINDGCKSAFREDSPASRISWVVGEVVKNDSDFLKHKQIAPVIMNCVATEMLYITNNRMEDRISYSYP